MASTSSTSSSIISALGAGSGVDMAALAANLATAQFQDRLNRISTQQEALQSKISTASTLKSQISQLASALGDRVRAGDLSPAPMISNSSVATVTNSLATRPAGNYSLEVFSLATAQTLASPSYASKTSTVGSGTLTLRFGTATSGGFTEDTSHAAVDITIPAGATLQDVAAKINSSGAGVTAYIAQASDGAKLVIKGKDGTANGFVIDAAETAGDEGLAALAWNPSAGDSSRLLTTAGNAEYALDGISMTSPSNNLGQIAPALSVTLTGTNAGNPAQITFNDPSSAITTAMQDLTTALNEIMTSLNTATNPKGGDLARDDGARALQRQLVGLASMIIMPNASSTSVKTLSDLGLSIQRDGTFSLDTSRLQASLTRDPTGAAAMFTNGLYGVYATINKIASKATSVGVPGSLAGSVDSYTKKLSQISEENTKIAEQQEALRARLATQFSSADTRISSYKSTLSFLQAQVAAWNAQKS
jgi:flagellar hook-associated protein 2